MNATYPIQSICLIHDNNELKVSAFLLSFFELIQVRVFEPTLQQQFYVGTDNFAIIYLLNDVDRFQELLSSTIINSQTSLNVIYLVCKDIPCSFLVDGQIIPYERDHLEDLLQDLICAFGTIAKKSTSIEQKNNYFCSKENLCNITHLYCKHQFLKTLTLSQEILDPALYKEAKKDFFSIWDAVLEHASQDVSSFSIENIYGDLALFYVVSECIIMDNKNNRISNVEKCYKYGDQILMEYGSNIQTMLQQGNLWFYHSQCNLQNAIAVYQKILKTEPTSIDAWYKMGLCYAKLIGGYGPAIQKYQHTLLFNKNHYQALYWQALCFEKLEQFDKALSNYQAIISLFENNFSSQVMSPNQIEYFCSAARKAYLLLEDDLVLLKNKYFSIAQSKEKLFDNTTYIEDLIGVEYKEPLKKRYFQKGK